MSSLPPALHDTIHIGDCVAVLDGLPDKCADLVFADPPYNLQLTGELYRPNQTRVAAVTDAWDQFASFAEYDAFTRRWLTACRRVLKDTGALWVIGSYHNIYRVGAIVQDLGYWIINDVVWVKTNPMPQFRGVRFANAHETLIWAKKSAEQTRYTFNYRALKAANDDRQMRSDWVLPICGGRERLKDADGVKVHSTQKPESLLYRVLLASTRPGDLVIDPFFGTGTTGAAAKKLGRRYLGIERDPAYAAAARARLDAIPAPAHVDDAAIYAGISSGRAAPRLPFAALLEAGLLLPGQPLMFDRDAARSAVVLADGTLRLPDGRTGSIHQLGAMISGAASCNGWEHWYYADESGHLHAIDTLRQRLRREMG